MSSNGQASAKSVSGSTEAGDEEGLVQRFSSRLQLSDEAPNDFSDDLDWTPDENYYVHIDVVSGSSQLVSSRINSFMIRQDSFDPRRAFNFPTELLDENQPDTLDNRREVVGIGRHYYEFWKVRRVFRVVDFRAMVNLLPKGTVVRLVRIIDNDHEITNWHGEFVEE